MRPEKDGYMLDRQVTSQFCFRVLPHNPFNPKPHNPSAEIRTTDPLVHETNLQITCEHRLRILLSCAV